MLDEADRLLNTWHSRSIRHDRVMARFRRDASGRRDGLLQIDELEYLLPKKARPDTMYFEWAAHSGLSEIVEGFTR